MYSSKSVGLRMEPWRTPALTGYSCEGLPSRKSWCHQLLRKEEIRLYTWPEIKASKVYVYEEEQDAKPCQKPLMYQMLQLE